MENFIIRLGNMSLQASIIILVVLAVRPLFEMLRVPKKYANIMWFLPYFCMILPWRIKSGFTFWRRELPLLQEQQINRILEGASAAEGIPYQNVPDSAFKAAEDISTASVGNTAAISQTIKSMDSIKTVDGADFAELILLMILIVWSVGVVVLMLNCLFAFIRLHRRLICSVETGNHVYLADDIDMPFVFGITRPRIYLPSDLREDDYQYVLEHERTHIMRKDPMRKLFFFLVTCIHWFNPLVWLAFHYMEKDMEMACDEETIRRIGIDRRKQYAKALLLLSAGKKERFAIPLAFGEGNTKGRIKKILKYKKTVFLSGALGIIITVILTAGFLTEAGEYEQDAEGISSGTSIDMKDNQTTEKNNSTEQPEDGEDFDVRNSDIGSSDVEVSNIGSSNIENSGAEDPNIGDANTGSSNGRESGMEDMNVDAGNDSENGAIWHREGYQEVILHLYIPQSVIDIGYATVGLVPEEEMEANAQRAMRELYDLTGTQIEECYYFAYDTGNYVFALTKEDLEHDRCFYTHQFENDPSIQTIYMASAREVWYSPVNMFAYPEGYASMTEADRAIWFVTHSALYNGQNISFIYHPYENEDEAWRIVMEDGTAYEIWMNAALDNETFSNIAGPYPDNNIRH